MNLILNIKRFPRKTYIAWEKIPLTMKLFLFCFLCSFGLIHAADSYAQRAIVSLRVQNATVGEVLEELRSQTDFDFFYNNNHVDLSRHVTLSADKSDIFSVLEAVFAGTDVRYTVLDKKIILGTETTHKSSIAQPSILVKGKVVDANGEGIIGANVKEAGTQHGTITDLDGNFSLKVSSPHVELEISYIGYKSVKVKAQEDKMVNVTLEEDSEQLDEVVVVGFGTQKKVNLTGAVGVTTAKELRERPVTNTLQALQGLIPGLNIAQNTGELNSTPAFNIRGTGTIGSGSTGAPLVLIDGAEGNLMNVNPQDIETISVLKDAAASSIYGSRAPFGVILVTTKRGTSGSVNINYNNNFRWSSPTVMPEWMDSYSFATYINDANQNSFQAHYFDVEWLQRIKAFQMGTLKQSIIEDPNNPGYWGSIYSYGCDNIDLYDYLYKDWTFAHEHNVSTSGGNDKFNFYMSMGYLGQDGMMKVAKDELRKYMPTAKINVNTTDWLEMDYTVRFTRSDYVRPTFMNSMWSNIGRQGWPFLPIYDPNGHYINKNFLYLQGGNTTQQNDILSNHAALTLVPIQNWITKAEVNYNVNTYDQKAVQLMTYLHDVAGNPYVQRNTSSVGNSHQKDNFFNFNLYTTYNFKIKETHWFKVMAGMQYENFKRTTMGLSRNGVIVDDLPVVDLTSGLNYDGTTAIPSVNGSSGEWATAGYFARLNYDYGGRYLFEANLRYDGSSRFRANKRWNWFPSFSLGWNIANESFFDLQSVNMLKLRASFGSLGNQNTDNWYPTYQIIPAKANSGTWLQNGAKPNIATVPALISSTLTWEKIRSWNIGTDFSLLNGRLSGSFDYFVRKTLDMVGPARELPSILGIDVPKSNNTDLKTYGFELVLEWKDRLPNDFSYSTTFMLSDNQTKILRYPNETNSLSTYIAGRMVGDIWGYETIGIAKTKEEMEAHLATLPHGGQNALGSEWTMGDIMYKDLNGDGKINSGANTLHDPGDMKKIGNNTNRFRFSLDLAAQWKGFDLRLFFQGVGKRDYWNGSNAFWGNGGFFWDVIGYKEHLDYFRAEPSNDLPTNIDAYYPRPVMNSKNHQTQTAYLQNGAYIRLKNITLGYTLPKPITQKFSVQSLRFFFSGENLWTGTKLKSMFDPEGIAGTNSTSGEGYPIQKTVSVGLSVTL